MLNCENVTVKNVDLVEGEVYTLAWCNFQDVIVEHVKITSSKLEVKNNKYVLEIEFTLADSKYGFPHVLVIKDGVTVFIGKGKLDFSIDDLMPLGRDREELKTNRFYYSELIETIIDQVGQENTVYAYAENWKSKMLKA